MTEKQQMIVAELFSDEIIFDGELYHDPDVEYSDEFDSEHDGVYTKEDGTKYYAINMGDVFAWGCADSENVTLEELEEAYDYVQTRPVAWNAWIEWVSQRRQSVPQMPVLLDMQRKTPDERVAVPWYDAYDIECRSKMYDIQKALKNGAEIDEIRQIVEAPADHPFINKKK